eukprot:scaffold119011_cov63-Phaeocystis_antarctica.AAC.3
MNSSYRHSQNPSAVNAPSAELVDEGDDAPQQRGVDAGAAGSAGERAAGPRGTAHAGPRG